MEKIELIKAFSFEAAHFLPNVPEGHKCRRMHGHSFRFEVHLSGEISEDTGWMMDFGEIKKIIQPLIDQNLDHYLLNEVEGLSNPTSENLAVWLWKKIKPSLPLLTKLHLHETCTSSCIYKGE